MDSEEEAMLRAIGMTDADWDKPQIGVASSWNEVTPCNLPLDRLVSHRLPLDDVERAFELMHSGDALRVVLDLDGRT